MSKIELTPGRLALRRPELGPLLIVTVEGTFESDGSRFIEWSADVPQSSPACDFLPVLRPGDVVPAGSLLWNIYGRFEQEVVKDNEIRTYQSLVFALLRYGPEEDA